MSDDLKVDVLARLNRLEMFAGHVADWAGNPLLHIKARALLEADAQDAEPKGLTTNETLSDHLAKRMEALVRRMAADNRRCFTAELDEARAIVALLPEPVDADLVEARKIVEETGAGGIPYSEGNDDWRPAIKIALAAIRRGRALERDSREG